MPLNKKRENTEERKKESSLADDHILILHCIKLFFEIAKTNVKELFTVFGNIGTNLTRSIWSALDFDPKWTSSRQEILAKINKMTTILIKFLTKLILQWRLTFCQKHGTPQSLNHYLRTYKLNVSTIKTCK